MSHGQGTGIIADKLNSYQATPIAALVARYALVIVIAWFGAMKFTYYEHTVFHPWSPTVPP